MANKDYNQLQKGKTYKVTQEFIDYDGASHPVGETWIYTDSNYFPYEAGVTFFVLKDGVQKTFRFQDEPEQQRTLLETFLNYVVSID